MNYMGKRIRALSVKMASGIPKRRKMGFKKRAVIFLVSLAVLITLLFLYVENTIRPITEEFAVYRAQNMATLCINEAVYRQLAEDEITYSDLIEFEKDIGGRIAALKTNIYRVNNLKSKLVAEISKELQSLKITQIKIPAGNLINGGLFSGRGPMIPIKLVPVGAVEVDFTSVFTSAGINQTRHQIIMSITTSVSILLPIRAATSEVKTSVCIAETVIVGDVPSSFAEFSLDGSLKRD